jgi:hypothetical protein
MHEPHTPPVARKIVDDELDAYTIHSARLCASARQQIAQSRHMIVQSREQIINLMLA